MQNSVIHEFTSSLWNTVAESDLMMPKHHLIVCNMVMPKGAHMWVLYITPLGNRRCRTICELPREIFHYISSCNPGLTLLALFGNPSSHIWFLSHIYTVCLNALHCSFFSLITPVSCSTLHLELYSWFTSVNLIKSVFPIPFTKE